MTPEKLAALRRLHEAATPGEWVVRDGEVRDRRNWTVVKAHRIWNEDAVDRASRNAEWIATAHNEWNVLLDEIDRLRGTLERIQHLAALRMIDGAPGFDRIEEMAREALGTQR